MMLISTEASINVVTEAIAGTWEGCLDMVGERCLEYEQEPIPARHTI